MPRPLGELGETLHNPGLESHFRRAAANRAADVLADQRRIALSESEAVRFLDAQQSL